MSYYKQQIIKATNCTPADAAEIEEIMRDYIFNSTLDWLTKAQFDKGAKEAHQILIYMHSPEGKAYMAEIEKQMLGEH